jgi:hypothetical protein
MNEDALLLQGIMLFDICHMVDYLAEGNKIQTTVKIYREMCHFAL